MCNINIIYNKQNKESKKIPELMNVMSYSSWNANNQDGEGFLLLDDKGIKTRTSNKKLRYHKKGYLLASHQRFATSGYGNENIHPYKKENLILMHNGVFANRGDNKTSDTKDYFNDLFKRYKKNNNIIDAIKKTNKESSGSWSVFLYDELKKKMYYYKEESTKMYKIENKEWLIMSTNEENIEYASYYLNIKNKMKEPKGMIIYEITKNGLKELSTFEEKPYKTTETIVINSYNGYSQSDYYNRKYKRDKVSNIISEREDIETNKIIDKMMYGKDSFCIEKEEWEREIDEIYEVEYRLINGLPVDDKEYNYYKNNCYDFTGKQPMIFRYAIR